MAAAVKNFGRLLPHDETYESICLQYDEKQEIYKGTLLKQYNTVETVFGNEGIFSFITKSHNNETGKKKDIKITRSQNRRLPSPRGRSV